MKLALTQTLAIFKDAYRELNSKKMFWIVLILSGVVVAILAAMGLHQTTNAHGFHEQRVSLFGLEMPFPFPVQFDRRTLYLGMFSNLGVGFWLTWGAMILALISTAGIFPNFLTGGDVDLYLSRPMGRLRLFLTKYASGLLFVTLQVTVFALGSYLAIGLRANVWAGTIFWAIPLVVCIFSYLFGFCALIGVLTRSTLAAILLTLLFWFGLYVVEKADQIFLVVHISDARQLAFAQRSLDQAQRAAAVIEPATTEAASTTPWLQAVQQAGTVEQRRRERDEAQSDLQRLVKFERIAKWTKAVLPKTTETNFLMDRAIKFVPPQETSNPWDFSQDTPADHPNGMDPDIVNRAQQVVLHRSLWWTLGTSLGFEAMMLAIGAFVFCRRDY